MDLRFTEEQDLLRQTVREMCVKFSSPEIVRELENDPAGYRADFWEQLSTVGITGLAIPERFGGAEQTALETVVVYEEFGRALAASPHLVSCVTGASALLAGGTDEQQAAWLPRIASGESVVSIAWLEPGRGCGPDGIELRAERDGSGWRLDGPKIMVPFASSAGALLTLARTDEGIGVFLVDPSSVDLTFEKTLARDAMYTATFDRVEVPGSSLLNGGWSAWSSAAVDAQIALAAYCVGGAERAHEMAVTYAKERVQFDHPIGAFQGVAHPLADTATEIEGSKVLTYQAAWVRARGGSARTAAAMAKYQAADTFKHTTKVGEQTLGGIGFTLEIDMQLYFRRAKQLEIAWWDPGFLEEQIAAAELDGEAPFVGLELGRDG
jgi:alkylation response protein AidB-like acyl-CoA dehydrogenase